MEEVTSSPTNENVTHFLVNLKNVKPCSDGEGQIPGTQPTSEHIVIYLFPLSKVKSILKSESN